MAYRASGVCKGFAKLKLPSLNVHLEVLRNRAMDSISFADPQPKSIPASKVQHLYMDMTAVRVTHQLSTLFARALAKARLPHLLSVKLIGPFWAVFEVLQRLRDQEMHQHVNELSIAVTTMGWVSSRDGKEQVPTLQVSALLALLMMQPRRLFALILPCTALAQLTLRGFPMQLDSLNIFSELENLTSICINGTEWTGLHMHLPQLRRLRISMKLTSQALLEDGLFNAASFPHLTHLCLKHTHPHTDLLLMRGSRDPLRSRINSFMQRLLPLVPELTYLNVDAPLSAATLHTLARSCSSLQSLHVERLGLYMETIDAVPLPDMPSVHALTCNALGRHQLKLFPNLAALDSSVYWDQDHQGLKHELVTREDGMWSQCLKSVPDTLTELHTYNTYPDFTVGVKPFSKITKLDVVASTSAVPHQLQFTTLREFTLCQDIPMRASRQGVLTAYLAVLPEATMRSICLQNWSITAPDTENLLERLPLTSIRLEGCSLTRETVHAVCKSILLVSVHLEQCTGVTREECRELQLELERNVDRSHAFRLTCHPHTQHFMTWKRCLRDFEILRPV